jgi:hypothetical protein
LGVFGKGREGFWFWGRVFGSEKGAGAGEGRREEVKRVLRFGFGVVLLFVVKFLVFVE